MEVIFLCNKDSKIPERAKKINEKEHLSDDSKVEPLHISVLRRIEDFVRKNHGYQALYADCFQTKEEFRQMFDHTLVDKFREKYGCSHRLPEVFDKVGKHSRK
jgi:hypothetical protein